MARVAIVTGGTRGIGEAVSVALQAEGMTVAANYGGDDAKAAAFTGRTGIKSYKWNVADHQSCLDGVKQVEADLGPVDVLVNNAGITRDGTLMKMSYEMWKEVMDVNLGGCFNMAKAVFASMRSRGYGRIVSIGSISGQSGQHEQVNYAAAKSGIQGFTKALAQEGARLGITVNMITPGQIETERLQEMLPAIRKERLSRIPVTRFGLPWEVARGVAFLCSEQSGYITGSTVSINGGEQMY